MHGFLAELKRRNVIRVAVFYLAASWLVLQVTDVLSSLLAPPKTVGYFMVVLVAIGLPVALVVAWVYELTPEGLRRDTEQELDPAARGSPLPCCRWSTRAPIPNRCSSRMASPRRS